MTEYVSAIAILLPGMAILYRDELRDVTLIVAIIYRYDPARLEKLVVSRRVLFMNTVISVLAR